MTAKYLLLLSIALCLTGCIIETQTGPTRTESFAVDRDSSEFLKVNVQMAAGDLRIYGGSAKFLEGSATYNVEAWKPVVKYSSAAGHGNIDISQPGLSHSHTGNIKYTWDMRLANDIPIDFTAHFGAGQARLDLGSLSLRGVDIEMGVGRLEMDLRGTPKRNYDVRIRGGVGEAVVRLPRDVGVYAKAQGGIGAIETTGLRKEGDHMVNDAYDHSKASIHLNIQGGIGAIKLYAE